MGGIAEWLYAAVDAVDTVKGGKAKGLAKEFVAGRLAETTFNAIADSGDEKLVEFRKAVAHLFVGGDASAGFKALSDAAKQITP